MAVHVTAVNLQLCKLFCVLYITSSVQCTTCQHTHDVAVLGIRFHVIQGKLVVVTDSSSDTAKL
jgi:hypothetical protein